MSEVGCAIAGARGDWAPLEWGRPRKWHPLRAMGTKQVLERRFERLLRRWKEATYLTSSATQLTDDPAYLEICAMGEDVVPLILRAIRNGERHLGVALRRITRQSVVGAELSGKLDAQAEAWLRWGRERGLID